MEPVQQPDELSAPPASGLDVDMFLDMKVEDGGLGADGTRTWRAGPHDVYLFLTDDGEVELAIFERASGRALGAQTQVLGAAYAGDFLEARAVQRVLADALATQKARLEGALVTERTWCMSAWQQVFGTNPLMRHLATRLVWRLADGTAFMMVDGLPVDAAGAPVALPADGLVRLLHPATADVAAWRDRIVGRRLVQPFKQVFREVVAARAGDAGTRLDGLVVRQRAFVSQLRARGWTGMSGMGTGGWVGQLSLPGQRFAAVLTLRPTGSRREPGWRQVAIGRLEFVARGDDALATEDDSVETHDGSVAIDDGSVAPATPGRQGLPLGQVPPVAYSEALRDVLLAAAGAGGADGGALAEIADARAALVEGLLPQLGVDHVATVEGRGVRVVCGSHAFCLDLGTGVVTLAPTGRAVDLDGLERVDVPLYLPHEGADAGSRSVLATLVWLAKFGRACAERLP